MRRNQLRYSVAPFLALVSLLAPGYAHAASAAYVQATAGAAQSSQSLSVTFPVNTSAGDLVLIAFDHGSSASLSSLTDSQGNVLTPVGNALTSPGGTVSRVYYAKNIKGGPETVTVTLSTNSPWMELYLTEYSGIDPNNPIDAQAGATGNAGAASSGTATTTSAGDVIFGYCFADWSCTSGSGFNARSTLDGNLIEDMLAGSAGNYAATGTANNGWTMQMVALKPASGTVGAPPAITSAASASGTVGSAFSYQITATNSPTSFGASNLPAGLSVNTSTGVISGTPTAAGTSSVTISATNAGGTGSATLTLTINPAPPAITSATSASGTVGSAFSYQITATNSPTSFGASNLPAGLSVSTASGLISGTPTATGTSSVTLSATNAGGTGHATLTLTINNPAAPVITSSNSATGMVGSAFSYQITATNNPNSYGATGLPAGLSVNTSTGLISGTPTATGTSSVTLSATNAGGTGSATMSLTINNPAPPAITSGTTASGATGSPFSYQITATNNPTSYGAAGLPSGLSVNTSSGLISGTPTTTGTYTVTLSATNAGGTGNATLTLTISSVALVTIIVSPQNAVIQDSGGSTTTQAYTATGYFSDGSSQNLTSSVSWASTNTSVATVTPSGVATSASLPAGQSAGFTSITATSGSINGVSILSVTSHTGNGFAGVFTQHNDISRTGQNLNETVLTPTVVGSTTTFGKLFTQPVDGFIYAQPLYVPNVTIPGNGTHNVVYVVTEGDSVYAFDADSNTGGNSSPLWHASLIDTAHGATAGETTVNSVSDLNCTDLIPQVGITSTPVIDPSANVMYVVAKSKLTNGSFVQRLHVLNITTGNEVAPGPVAISASVPGTADGGTTDDFQPLPQLNRSGLLLVNGTVYVGFGSHCDAPEYQGWLFAYDATTLAQKAVLDDSPNYIGGGIWLSGTGLAADSQANLFVPTGNGPFDTTGTVLDFGDSIFKSNLGSGTLFPIDYFTPFNQEALNANDTDVSSGGVLLLPDQAGGHPHELVEGSKEGTIYVIDRDQMTTGNQHYCANCNSDPQIVQELPAAIGGVRGGPAFWNNTVYFWGANDALQAYPMSSGQLATSPASSSTFILNYPGAVPVVSANGATNGIVWAIDATQFGPPQQSSAGPAVLHAFNATNVANEFYNTTMAANGRDTAGSAVKFTVPTVANGKVYMGTQTELDVYGPLP